MGYDCIVIGSGVAGMTAALVSARAGRSTLLLEQASRTAPTLRGFSREGVHIDTGLHYLGSAGPGEAVDTYFRHMGLGGLSLVPYSEQGFDTMRIAGREKELRLPSGYAALESQLVQDFPNEREGIISYLRDIRSSFESSPFLNIDKEPSPKHIAGDIFDTVSLASYLDSTISDPILKSLLSMHCLLYGTAPSEAPFSLHAKIVGSYYQSAHKLIGGGAALVGAYDTAMAEAGVEVRTGTRALSLELNGDGAVEALVTNQGERFETSSCIAASHPGIVLSLLPPEVWRPAFRKRIKALPPTPSAHMLFLAADAPIPALEHSNIFACPSPDIASFFSPGRSPEEGPFYIAASSAAKGSAQSIVAIAPGDYGTVKQWENSTRGSRPAAYAEYKERTLNAMQDALFAACPELTTTRRLDGATPLTLGQWMNAPQGALYGARHSTAHFNPSPVTRIPGLYLAGQSVVAPGVLGAVVSAYLACGVMSGFKSLWKELRECR